MDTSRQLPPTPERVPVLMTCAKLEDAVRTQLGPLIKTWRKEAGLSLKQAAKKTGFVAGTLSKIENGKLSVSLGQLFWFRWVYSRATNHLVADLIKVWDAVAETYLRPNRRDGSS